MKIVTEVEILSRGYVRKGGKTNRRQQQGRMVAFAEFCATQGAFTLGQVGRAHVIRYWRATLHLSDSTRYNHWRALCVLWKLSGKTGTPPPPHSAQPRENIKNNIPTVIYAPDLRLIDCNEESRTTN